MLKEILRLVRLAHAAGQDALAYDGRFVQRIRSGMNNALYRVEVDGQVFACKLCVQDERRRARREYNAMRLIEVRGLELGPRPLGLDERCAVVPYPAVVYAWQEGQPLGLVPTQEQLAALLASMQRQLACQPGWEDAPGLTTAWFHWFDRQPYLRELNEFLDLYGAWLADQPPDGGDLGDRLRRLVEKCDRELRNSPVDLRREAVSCRLCHVDPNLANAIWCPDGAVRWVDWEYSGWGDPALELADFRWHIAAMGIGQAQHDWLRARIIQTVGDEAFVRRLAFWDRLLATRWPFLVLRRWWSEVNGPDRERLNNPAAEVGELHHRFMQLIERAEVFKLTLDF